MTPLNAVNLSVPWGIASNSFTLRKSNRLRQLSSFLSIAKNFFLSNIKNTSPTRCAQLSATKAAPSSSSPSPAQKPSNPSANSATDRPGSFPCGDMEESSVILVEARPSFTKPPEDLGFNFRERICTQDSQ